MLKIVSSSCLLVLFSAFAASAEDWNQWRGATRDGVAANSPPLLDSLPESGLKPLWISDETIPSAWNGGWSSPVVANGKVYIFTHAKNRVGDGDLPKRKFPWLPPEKRVGMSDEDYAEYERKRRDEDEVRSRFYNFQEVTFCLDVSTGMTFWKNERKSTYSRFLQSGSPAVVDGRLFVLGAGRVARCLDADTGEDIWQAKLPGEFRDEMMQSSFAVVSGVAVVLATEMFGLDVETGNPLWKTHEKTDRQLQTSPVVWSSSDGPRVICNLPGGITVCIEPRSGKELWRVNSQAGHATPVVVGNRLLTYGSSRKSGLRCFKLSQEGAEHLWTCQRTADSGSSPVVLNDYVYVQGERRLACVSLEDGKSTWMTQLDMNRPRYTSLVAADSKVIYGFEGMLCFAADSSEYRQLINAKIDKEGLLADESTFRKMLNIDELEKTADGQVEAERLWRDKIGNSGPLACATPAIANGKIFIRLKNSVACYDLRVAATDK